jgi:hypothetical protein
MVVLIRMGEERLALQPGEHEIGRAHDCRIVLDDLDVSRRHARLAVSEAGEISLLDLGSRNGTIVDGKPAPAWSPCPLRTGAVIALGSHVLVVEGPENAHASAGPAATRPRRDTTSALRSCPVCRDSNARDAARCRRCGLDFTDPEAMELHEFTGSRSTLRRVSMLNTEPDGVLVISHRLPFLRLLRPAFTVSDDLVLGAGDTLEQARTDLASVGGLGGLAPGGPAPRVSLVLVDAESVGAGLDPPALREQVGVPVVLFGTVDDPAGFAQAARLGADTFVRQSASAILFVARVRLCLARLRRNQGSSRSGTAVRHTPTPVGAP